MSGLLIPALEPVRRFWNLSLDIQPRYLTYLGFEHMGLDWGEEGPGGRGFILTLPQLKQMNPSLGSSLRGYVAAHNGILKTYNDYYDFLIHERRVE